MTIKRVLKGNGGRHILRLAALWACLGLAAQAQAQTAEEQPYKRSSLYTVLGTHRSQPYGAQIDSVFIQLPMPDKYEDNNLPARYIVCSAQEPHLTMEHMRRFIYTSDAAKKTVAKWFDRNPETGTFDLDLVTRRGNYNASEADVREALLTKRGLTVIADAGEDLIENSFLLINDIIYVDKEKNAAIASSIFSGLALVAAGISVLSAVERATEETKPVNTATDKPADTVAKEPADTVDAVDVAALVAGTAALGAVISDAIAGFTVKVTSYLYRLRWNDSTAAVFYNDLWCDTTYAPEEIARRKALFDSISGENGLFAFDYIGSYKVKSDKTVLRGLHDNNDVIRKVCARALDKNIAALQRKYEVFKVKTPVTAIDGPFIRAQIGMKEGIKPNTKFEVLERRMDEEGRVSYQRTAVVKPVKGLIWDNRFMAAEEGAVDAKLNATTFRRKGAGLVAEGMLLRQLK